MRVRPKTIGAVLCLVTCVLVTAPASAQNIGAAGENLRRLPEDRQLALAFQAAFGATGKVELEIENETVEFTPAKILWIGEVAILISNGFVPAGSHASTGQLAVHYLRPTPTTFSVIGSWNGLGAGSEYGSPPEWRIRDDLASVPVIETRGEHLNQGYFAAGAELIELRPTGPVSTASFLIACSNEGAMLDEKDFRTLNGTIVPDVRDESFIVRYTGSWTRHVRHVRKGDVFPFAPGTPASSGCSD